MGCSVVRRNRGRVAGNGVLPSPRRVGGAGAGGRCPARGSHVGRAERQHNRLRNCGRSEHLRQVLPTLECVSHSGGSRRPSLVGRCAVPVRDSVPVDAEAR